MTATAEPPMKVAIFGGTGTFGHPISLALHTSPNFSPTIFTRRQSSLPSTLPTDIPKVTTSFTLPDLTAQLRGFDAVMNVLGPGGIEHAVTLVDAALAAGITRFIINDFGWGPDFNSFPEFHAIHTTRLAGWNRAAQAARESEGEFSWTGISIGNPIDWALGRFPIMGFNPSTHSATIYDSGTESFTGTTLQGIGQAVLGVLQNLASTGNRFVKVRSIKTNQKSLLQAFENATGREWEVHRQSSLALRESGQAKFKAGQGGWILELVVAQLYEEGEGRCLLVNDHERGDCEMLGVREESVEDIVAKVLKGM